MTKTGGRKSSLEAVTGDGSPRQDNDETISERGKQG